MSITFRPATDDDALHVGENLRESDRLELSRGGNDDPLKSPLKSLHKSLIAWTMVREGRAIAVFGVAPFKGHETTGIVWLLGTPELERAAKSLVMGGRYYVGLMSRLFPHLCNAVDVENSSTRRWLRALGFVEGDDVTINDNPFLLVHYRRPKHV